MKDFLRVVRLALAYRWTIVASALCALMIGILWGANIATIQPFIEVAFNGQSLQQWVNREIASAEAKIDELETDLPLWRKQLQDGDSSELRDQIAAAETRLEAERSALARFQWIKPTIDDWLPHDAFATVIVIALALLVGTLLKVVFLIINGILVDKLALLATFDLRKQLFRSSLKMDLAAFGEDGSGELMSRFTFDMENVLRGVRELFGKAVREPLKMLACLIGAALICWRLLLVSLVLAPLAAYLMNRLGRSLKRANRKAMEEMSGMYALLEESFLGIKVVKAFTMERAERSRFHASNKNYYQKAMRIARYESLTKPITELTGITVILVAVICGAYLVMKGETHILGMRMCDRPLATSSLLLFYGMLSGVSDPARKMSEVFSRLQRAAAASDRIYALIDRQPTIRDPEKPRPAPRHRKEISFENISFAYKPGVPVLNDVSLSVPFGETIAIVGPNGCGKSTLLNLAPRFYDPDQGGVKLDGIDVRDFRLRDLRRQIGLVTQETLLFDDTVFNNIRYGCPSATKEQVVAAAKQAHAHRFIEEKLSHGYETVLGPQGGQLSGGQRQRIALARAILRDPAILILDEATSQIDLESEQVIHQVLQKFIRNRTTFIITHRMSTLALADRIVAMNAGKILDVGTHEELLKRCDLYSRLYAVQFRESA
jgi:ATP-binding cassette subfamily B protein/subfamily B ATP-binding cassette protein MsbA